MKYFKNSQKIYTKYYKNGWFWVSLRVVVLLKYEVWVWAVLTLCQYGMRTDTVSVSVYTNKSSSSSSWSFEYLMMFLHGKEFKPVLCMYIGGETSVVKLEGAKSIIHIFAPIHWWLFSSPWTKFWQTVKVWWEQNIHLKKLRMGE